MESCIQEIQVIRKALKRRADLFRDKDVPAQHELFERQGKKMGQIIMDGMSHVARELMGADRAHKVPAANLWISPESRLKGEICVTQTSNVDGIKALTHEGILDIGAAIEKKYEKKFSKMLKRAVEDTSEFERFECERRLKFALKVQQDIYIKKLDEIEDRLHEEFDKEKIELQALYDKKYGCILAEVISNTNAKFSKKLAIIKENCKCKTEEVLISSTSSNTTSSLQQSSASTPSLDLEVKKKTESDGPVVDAAKRLWNDFEHHLRTQRNILQCSNVTDLIHFICTEKLESQKRVENVQKECCEKIELLKRYLFDICCKVRCMECQCPREEEKQAPRSICIGARFCRCEHRKVCLNNDPEKSQLFCSCCGKEIDKVCGGKHPMAGKGKRTCTCTPTDLNIEKHQSPDEKIYCCCGHDREKEVPSQEEVTKEKELCCVCRAKQICEIVGKMNWPVPPRPPCICPDKSIPCRCQYGRTDNVDALENAGKFSHVGAAVVLPEYIGQQIFCECHSSSSDEECPCSESRAEKELLRDRKAVDVCWTEIPGNECVELKSTSKNEVFDVSSSSSVPSIKKSEKDTLSSSSEESSSSAHSRYSCGEYKTKLLFEFNAKEIVDYIFQLSTNENLQSPEYIKRRLEEELEKKLEQIITRKTVKKEEVSESCSQGLSSSSVSRGSEDFIQRLLELGKKREEPKPTKFVYMPVPESFLPEPVEKKMDETTHEIWKDYVPLPKYLVPMASLFEGGWSYKQTTDKDWEIILSLIEKNKNEDKKCFAGTRVD